MEYQPIQQRSLDEPTRSLHIKLPVTLYEKVKSFCEKKKTLDKIISDASKNWRIERMARLDRSILRLAAFEIMFMEDIPPKVSLDEAVEIGKKFGGNDSGSFINGILDKIYNTLLEQGRLKN